MAFGSIGRLALIRAGGLLALALLLGRVSGLVRELVLAANFGVGIEADFAILILTVPDLLVNLLLAGGLSAALVPRLRALEEREGGCLFRRTTLWVLLIFGVIAIVIAAKPYALFAVIAPGLPASEQLVGRREIILVALSIPLTALSGMTSAFLNANNRFFVAGLGTFLFNFIVISTLLLPIETDLLAVLAFGIFLGAFSRLGSQVLILPKAAFRLQDGLGKGHITFGTAFAAGVAASAFTLLPTAMIRAAASFLGSGNIALFAYAQKIVELPLGILVTTISTVALTQLSGHYANGQHVEARQSLYLALRLSLVLALIVVLYGMLLSNVAISTVFVRGNLGLTDALRISGLFKVLLLGVPFVAISSMAAADLNAQLRTTEVFKATAVSACALPFLAIPGLYNASATLLMLAAVGSQIILAALLAYRAQITLFGHSGILDPKTALASALACIPCLPLALAGTFHSALNSWIYIGIGGLGFIVSALVALALVYNRNLQ